MDEEVRREEDEKEFGQKKEEQERKDREKTEKNRARRSKARARKEKQNKGHKDSAEGSDGDKLKRKLAPNANAPKPAHEDEREDQVLNRGGEVKNTDEGGLVIEDDD
jgi:hypothetical protein